MKTTHSKTQYFSLGIGLAVLVFLIISFIGVRYLYWLYSGAVAITQFN
jgi:hypothetical protein